MQVILFVKLLKMLIVFCKQLFVSSVLSIFANCKATGLIKSPIYVILVIFGDPEQSHTPKMTVVFVLSFPFCCLC